MTHVLLTCQTFIKGYDRTNIFSKASCSDWSNAIFWVEAKAHTHKNKMLDHHRTILCLGISPCVTCAVFIWGTVNRIKFCIKWSDLKIHQKSVISFIWWGYANTYFHIFCWLREKAFCYYIFLREKKANNSLFGYHSGWVV